MGEKQSLGAGSQGAGSHSQGTHGPTMIVYGPELDDYDLGGDHPLSPERVRRAVVLLRSMGFLEPPGVTVTPPRPASLEGILSVHTFPYVEAVRRAQRIARHLEPPVDLSVFGLGPGDNPLFPSIYDTSLLIAGATMQAMEAVLSEEVAHAWSPAGGLHHAHPSYASGFCVFNDVALAIRRALEAGRRVAYVDLDGHHGDGVQDIFYDDPRVLTFSVHESGEYLFPGSGAVGERGRGAGLGTAVNVPLPPEAGDDAFLAAVDEVALPILHEFDHDVLVLQTGADSHWADPLTHLATTLRFLPRAVERLHSSAHELCDGRILMLGGGGYEWETVTPRAWAAAFIALLGERIPEELISDAQPRHPTVGLEEVRATIDAAREGALRLLGG